jgi:hypothetical protein
MQIIAEAGLQFCKVIVDLKRKQKKAEPLPNSAFAMNCMYQKNLLLKRRDYSQTSCCSMGILLAN